MDITLLTTKIIESMGGMIEFTEYALAHVLVPEIYKDRFQGRTELLLAFDFEVAEENPDSDFITYGSEILEVLMDIAISAPISDVRYAIVDRVEIINPEEKIRNAIKNDRLDVNILSERPVMGIWAAFVFRTKFLSSENFEEEHKIWVNMLTGNIDTGLSESAVFFEKNPLLEYPYTKICTFAEAYKKAQTRVSLLAEEIAQTAVSPQRISRETERLKSYYEELIEENKRRMSRKGLTAERQEDIFKKHEALQLEMERQISEIRENLIPKPTTELAHGITLHVPIIELVCNISNRSDSVRRVFYYECLTKQIF